TPRSSDRSRALRRRFYSALAAGGAYGPVQPPRAALRRSAGPSRTRDLAVPRRLAGRWRTDRAAGRLVILSVVCRRHGVGDESGYDRLHMGLDPLRIQKSQPGVDSLGSVAPVRESATGVDSSYGDGLLVPPSASGYVPGQRAGGNDRAGVLLGRGGPGRNRLTGHRFFGDRDPSAP